MRRHGKRTFLAVGLAVATAFATPKSYFYDNAPMKYRTLSGIKAKASDRFTFTLWHANYYRDMPIHIAAAAERWGEDFHPALGINFGQWGPVKASSEIAFYILERITDGYSEWQPRAFLNLDLPLGPVIIGLMNRLEYRMITTFEKQKRVRWRPRAMLSTSWNITTMKITPYVYWEHFYQKNNELDQAIGVSTRYREVEAGLNSRLSDKVTFGIGHMFQYNPDEANIRGNYSSHQLSLYFFYTVDLTRR